MLVVHSPMQARLAYRCALVLRDLIHPYLLRRQKKDLKDIIRLTAKTEQVRHEYAHCETEARVVPKRLSNPAINHLYNVFAEYPCDVLQRWCSWSIPSAGFHLSSLFGGQLLSSFRVRG